MNNEIYEKRREQMFPQLSDAQRARLCPMGKRRATETGQLLAEPGDTHRDFLIVLSGSIEILLPGAQGDELVHLLEPGEFSGEMSTLRGVGGFTRYRVREGGEVLALGEVQLRNVVQTDAEISELLLRAFILRRVGLMTSNSGDVILMGSQTCGATLTMREFLGRNAFAYQYVGVDGDEDVSALRERFHIGPHDIPVLIARGQVYRNPGICRAASILEMNPPFEPEKVYDLVVVGAGPGGLAAAVYGASEGLSTIAVESMAYGGQAGTSSKIENYLGFPTGISGQALAGRAFVQAQKFGAAVHVAACAKQLQCDTHPYGVELADGRLVRGHSIIIATGAQYRKLALADLERYTNVGIYHAATALEARLCHGEEVVIVGGGNSAGQAAIFLANGCRHVHIMVRADGLAESMSHYLIQRIESSPQITLHTRTQITRLEGSGRLERICFRAEGGEEETRDIGHVFLMTGAVPNTEWLKDCVHLDEHGFVCTGADLKPADLPEVRWEKGRTPLSFETSMPGVFAVGDVRGGSVKRVASAVGEGSVCVQFVHRILPQLKQLAG
ncbi:MAG TPA: FAD-dependent oxidoreductase [Burkholderiales bacterium]